MSKMGNYVVGMHEHPAFEMGYKAYCSGDSARLWIARAMNFWPDKDPDESMQAYALGWQDASTKEGPQP